MKFKEEFFLSAHQPNFLPWVGYFLKIAQSDIFVFSDDVQFSKQQAVNRTNLLVDGIDFQLTLPILRVKGKRIYEKKISKEDLRIFNKKLNQIQRAYKDAPFYEDFQSIMIPLMREVTQFTNLSDFNIQQINRICNLLDIKLIYRLGSEIGLSKFSANERILQRAQILSTRGYLCGHGSSSYQDDNWLTKNGIIIRYANYKVLDKFEDDSKYSIVHLVAKFGLNQISQIIKSSQAF